MARWRDLRRIRETSKGSREVEVEVSICDISTFERVCFVCHYCCYFIIIIIVIVTIIIIMIMMFSISIHVPIRMWPGQVWPNSAGFGSGFRPGFAHLATAGPPAPMTQRTSSGIASHDLAGYYVNSLQPRRFLIPHINGTFYSISASYKYLCLSSFSSFSFSLLPFPSPTPLFLPYLHPVLDSFLSFFIYQSFIYSTIHIVSQI